MAKELRSFTIKKLRKPNAALRDKNLRWVCNSLGFVSTRDSDETAYKIMECLTTAAKEGRGMTSDELSGHVKPTIGSVIYHLKKLMKSGLIVKMGSCYELRMESLRSTIEEIQREINMALDDVKTVSADIDSRFCITQEATATGE